MMTASAAAVYNMPDILYETFTALVMCNGTLPQALDIQCVLNARLNQGIRTNYLHMALSQFCVMMMNHYSQECILTTSCFHSASISGDISDNTDKCIRFFDKLCTEILCHGENESDTIFFRLHEVSKKLILEHGVGEKRLKDLHSLYESLFRFLCAYANPPTWKAK